MTGHLTFDTQGSHVFRIPVPTLTLPPLDTTNTYVIHDGKDAIIIDCGSDQAETVDEVATLIRSQGITQVKAYVLTHYHLDHTRGIPLLQRHFPAPVYVHPLDGPGAANEMNCTTADIQAPASTMTLGAVRLHITHQPGHTHGHLHILVEPDNLLIVGDHMAGEGSVWIGPPDGHMSDYYMALQQIIKSTAKLVLPGHGAPIPEPRAAGQALLRRRLEREQDIVTYLATGARTLDEIVTHLYRDRRLGAAMWVARKTTQAHLAHLIEQDRITRRCQAPDFQMYYVQKEGKSV